MGIITVGIDLAKNVFAAHRVDDGDKSVLVKPKVLREHHLPLIAPLPPRVIGMEALFLARITGRASSAASVFPRPSSQGK